MKVVVFVIGVLHVVFKAFVTWKLYVWFIQPLGFPVLKMSEVFGISLFYGLWTLKENSVRRVVVMDKDDNVDLTVNISLIIVVGIALLMGYFVK